MPFVAALTCIFAGWLIKEKVTKNGKEIELKGTDVLTEEIKISSPFRAQKAWAVMIKFVAPVLVIVILVWNLI